MASRPKPLPASLRARLIREIDQAIVVAVRKTRDPRGVADAVVELLKHFWTRESKSLRTLGDLDDLAAALSDRLDRLHAMHGLGPPSAPLKFDSAWMLAQIDAVLGLKWEGHAPEVVPAAPADASAEPDPRVAAATPGDFRAYRPGEAFADGELVRHPRFGDGCVTRVVDAGKIEVRFADGLRTLAQRAGAGG